VGSIKSLKSLGICFAVSAAALIVGCGGDSETTTVAGPTITVTTTVAAPAAPEGQAEPKGNPERQRPRQRSTQPSQNPQAEQLRRARRFRQRSPAGKRFQKQFGTVQGRPIAKCLKQYGGFGSGNPPASAAAAKERRAKLRQCFKQNAPSAFGGGQR
jgi:hypothetical protein